MINSNENNKYHYVKRDDDYIRVTKTDEMTTGVKSVQETLLLKLESDFNAHKECINFIDRLRDMS